MANCATNSCFCKVCIFICVTIAKLLAFLLAIICLPVVAIIVIAIFFYRTFVRFCACFHGDLGCILPSTSALLAGDEIYKQPLTCNVAMFQFDGNCDVSFMSIFIQDNWLGATTSEGRFKYSELRQSIVQFMGLFFWKNDTNFDVRNHVKLYGNEELEIVESQRKLNEIWNELSMKPFDAGRSPWEVIVIPDFRENSYCGEGRARWVMIFRWHHCLSDGFSILNLMSSIAIFDIRKVAKNNDLSTPKSFLSSCGMATHLILSAPYVILELLCQSKDKNEWHLSEKKLTRYWHLGVGKNLPISVIQDIKMGLNVSFSAVLLAAVAGTLRQMMAIQDGEENKKLPESLTCGIPLPICKHPEKLRNNWAIATICLPIREENPCKRVQTIDRRLKELKESNKPILSYKMAKWIGSLPACLIRAFVRNDITTAVCSIMPGPAEVLKNFQGKSLVDAGYINGLGPGRNGFSFSVFSYGGCVKFAVTVDSAFSPQDSLATSLILGIDDELNFLKQSCIKMITIQT